MHTIAEAAEFLRVSKRTVERRIASGDLVAFRLGRIVRITDDALDALINGRNQACESCRRAGLVHIVIAEGKPFAVCSGCTTEEAA